MELFWGVFFLVIGNILINAIVLNSNIKDRKILDSFVKVAHSMSLTYTEMAIKYNEVASGFNEIKRVSDLQADLISTIMTAFTTDPHLAPAAQEWLKKVEKEAHERINSPVDFPDMPQF